jgi:hypothetical protein
MKLIRYWRRIVVIITGLGAGLGMLAGAASAGTAMLPPPASDRAAGPAIPVVTAGGMPGWQITLIAVGAALVAAAIAVLLDRARRARQPGSAAETLAASARNSYSGSVSLPRS